MKVVYRKYENGEVIALFPEEQGDPTGQLAVAFEPAGGFYPVNAEAVLKNTIGVLDVPKRLQVMIKAQIESELEIVNKVTEAMHEARRADTDGWKKFPRISKAYL